MIEKLALRKLYSSAKIAFINADSTAEGLAGFVGLSIRTVHSRFTVSAGFVSINFPVAIMVGAMGFSTTVT
jgi:hypothetical protein